MKHSRPFTSPEPARIIRAARAQAHATSPSRRRFAAYEPQHPPRLDFHSDSLVDWSLVDSDDRFSQAV